MNKINKVLLVLLLCAGTQVNAWTIRFDRNTYGNNYEIFTFERESDYRKLLNQLAIYTKVENAAIKVAPVVGKVAGAAKAVPDPEFKAAMLAVELSSKALTEVLSAGLLRKPFDVLSKEGYTIDYYGSFKPSFERNYACKNAKQLTQHAIHSIKSNKDIFYVIYDKTAKEVRYANYGKAYGYFTFKLVDLVDEDTGQVLRQVGAVSYFPQEQWGNEKCPSVSGREIPVPTTPEVAPSAV